MSQVVDQIPGSFIELTNIALEEGWGVLGLNHENTQQIMLLEQRNARIAAEAFFSGTVPMVMVALTLNVARSERSLTRRHFAGQALTEKN